MQALYYLHENVDQMAAKTFWDFQQSTCDTVAAAVSLLTVVTQSVTLRDISTLITKYTKFSQLWFNFMPSLEAVCCSVGMVLFGIFIPPPVMLLGIGYLNHHLSKIFLPLFKVGFIAELLY